MIERDGSPVPITEPTALQPWEVVCPVHHLVYHQGNPACPECITDAL